MRLRSDIWIASYLRRAMAGGAYVTVRRKGVPEAGAIFIMIDRLDGNVALYGPAPQSLADDERGGRRFTRLHDDETIAEKIASERLGKETKFDPDCWIIDVEDRRGRSFLDDDLA